MNKKVIFVTLYIALACFVGIGTYAIIDTQVKKKQVETTQATTEAYVSESGEQVGIIDSIDNHVSSQKEDETTEYMADQISPDFVCYDKDDPNNPQHVVWYTPTTKATTEEATVAPPTTPGTTAPTNTTAPADTQAPANTTAPTGGETTPPAGGETTPPAGGETTPSAGGETTPPAGGETTPPAEESPTPETPAPDAPSGE